MPQSSSPHSLQWNVNVSSSKPLCTTRNARMGFERHEGERTRTFYYWVEYSLHCFSQCNANSVIFLKPVLLFARMSDAPIPKSIKACILILVRIIVT